MTQGFRCPKMSSTISVVDNNGRGRALSMRHPLFGVSLAEAGRVAAPIRTEWRRWPERVARATRTTGRVMAPPGAVSTRCRETRDAGAAG
jgi:hypothetical protein